MPPEPCKASSISSTVSSFVVGTDANAPDAATLASVLAATTSLGNSGEDVAVGVAERVPEAVQLAADGCYDRLQRLAAVFRLLDQPCPGPRSEGEPSRYTLIAAPVLVRA
jgi:hypothetical protein